MKKIKYTFTLGDNGKQKPKIPVRIINFYTGQSIRTTAILDTGADTCTFPSMITRTVGYDLREEDKLAKGTRGISGIEIDTYTHGFKIEVLDSDRKKVVRIIDVVANTIKSNSLPPILGTHHFLEKFKVSFDYVNNEFELIW